MKKHREKMTALEEEAINMLVSEKLTLQQIADRLGVSLTAAWKNVNRAIHKSVTPTHTKRVVAVASLRLERAILRLLHVMDTIPDDKPGLLSNVTNAIVRAVETQAKLNGAEKLELFDFADQENFKVVYHAVEPGEKDADAFYASAGKQFALPEPLQEIMRRHREEVAGTNGDAKLTRAEEKIIRDRVRREIAAHARNGKNGTNGRNGQK